MMTVRMLQRSAFLQGLLLVLVAAGLACDRAAPTQTLPPATPTAAPTVEERELSAKDQELIRALSLAGDWTWETNFRKHTVPYAEFIAGGPVVNGIPPIYGPKFSPVSQVDWLEAKEPVVALEINGDARAYPLQVLIWHEIVNDEVAGTPVAVTFCPLCNLALAFDRRVGTDVLEFGTTGLLRYSDLVMWDGQTQSWWQQALGEAVAGDYAGTRLQPLPAAIVSWQTFAEAYPAGKVLSRDTGYQRRYGQNPYAGYDSADDPLLFAGPTDERLHPMERVVGVTLGEETVAYPFSRLAEKRVVHDVVGGQPIVVLFEPSARSALDVDEIPLGREVGAAAVYGSLVDGKQLTFRESGAGFVDDQTGTTWGLLGQATGGPLSGKKLTPIPHSTHFWFAWAAFVPNAVIYGQR